MNMRGKNWAGRTLGVALLAAVAGGFWLRAGASGAEPAPETVRVRRATLDSTVSATGVIRAEVGAEIDVGSRVSGIVRSITVKVGERVARGDLLAVIDPTELQAQREQAAADLTLAEAQLAMARSDHARATALAAGGIMAPSNLDSAARDLEVARARVDLEHARVSSADIQLGYTEIRAPIRGVIADVTTREGETVAASFAAPTFVTIVDLDRLEVQAYVDETDIGRIFVGQEAAFSVDTYPDAEFTARVTAINPKAELQNGVVNYVVRLEFDDRDATLVLRPEMTAHVRLQVEQRVDVLTLPRRAIDGTEVDLDLIARDVAGLFPHRSPGVELVSAGAVNVNADPAQLKLLIRNLVDNAVKFSRPDSGPVVVSLEAEGDQVKLTVSDDGIGIPAGSGDRVFEPFVKLNPARGHGVGYGLGLNLCQRIVQLHGGTIRLLPRAPRGTDAVVTLQRG